MKIVAPERSLAAERAAPAVLKRSHDSGRINRRWRVQRWNRVGIRCECCGFAIEEQTPAGGRELLARTDVVIAFTRPIFGPRGEQLRGPDLVAHCPMCPGTMRSYSPDLEAAGRPDSVSEVEGNLFLTEGVDELWTILGGLGGSTLYDNSNAELGVGDSNTAAAYAQTDLQAATNKAWQAMDASYPQLGSGDREMDFKSTFGTSAANFDWLEVSLRNGSTRDKNLNRLVPAGGLGTKAAGTSWALTLTLSVD